MFFAFYVTAFYSKHSTGLSSLCSSGHRVTRLWVNLIRSAVVVQNPQNRRDLFLDFMNCPLPSAPSAASNVRTTNGDNTNNASWGKSETFQIFVFANGSLEKLSSLSALWIFASVLCFFLLQKPEFHPFTFSCWLSSLLQSREDRSKSIAWLKQGTFDDATIDNNHTICPLCPVSLPLTIPRWSVQFWLILTLQKKQRAA